MNSKKPIKVLLAKLGLDTHWRGIAVIARMLRAAGMEVLYLGNAYPEEIISIVCQEDVDAIGVSTLGGNHITSGKELIQLAKKNNMIQNKVFIIGGVFPPEDEIKLKKIGFDGVFCPGASRETIVDFVKCAVNSKKP